jgi:hypothetical protein
MNEMEVFDHDGWQFLCIAEELPLGVYQAVVRCRFEPDGSIRTLTWGSELHPSGWQALVRAKELAVEWASRHRRSDYAFV